MCGIAGIVRRDGTAVDHRLLERMTQTLAHRGPDGEGYVFLPAGRKGKPISVTGPASHSLRTVPQGYGVGFGHRRLAILDRSPLGHQPMSSDDEAVWITYNGEIYNYVELRQELQRLGWGFRSRTDTEVILRAYQEWGLDCLERLNGMFAFAVWDARHDRLVCARDRLGMKPFYYRATGDAFVFASEIKALRHDPTLPREPNERIVHDFLVSGLQDHTEETFFQGVHQLRPGHVLILEDGRVEPRRWWDLGGRAEPMAAPEHEDVGAFRALFEDAIRIHLRSDVRVGTCLSGGLDSSSIVCTLAALSSGVRTEALTDGDGGFTAFSCCFEDPACDERAYLRSVVARTGVDCEEVYPDGRQLFEEMPRILWFQDEPFAGTSFWGQWAVMKAAAARGVKVLLDGQGGDELLCGYPGYWGSHLADLLSSGALSRALREARLLRGNAGRLHPTVWANLARGLLPEPLVVWARGGLKRHARWIDPGFASRHADRRRLVMYENRAGTALGNHVAAYLRTHSLPALLHHEDRNAMAFSLEARLPFLDARLVDFLVRLPASLKLRDGRTKVILRHALGDVLPAEVRDRRDKKGFATPEDVWLRHTLREDLERLFASPSFERRGYWDAARVRQAYRTFCRDGTGIGRSLFRCLSVELWHQQFFP